MADDEGWVKGINGNAFVSHFRACEATGAHTRFVILPIDLSSASLVRSALVGCVLSVDVDPLQPDDVLAARTPVSMTSGPTDGLVAASTPTNTAAFDDHRHWLRGGLPESYSAESDEASLRWRLAMLDGLLTRDYSQWDVPRASQLPEILRWAANQNSGEVDDTACPVAKRSDVRAALHVLDRIGVTRRVSNYPAGSSSALGKKPKLYIRDTGLLHAVLGIVTMAQLRECDALGGSWEGYAIEALIFAAGSRATPQFYRVKGIAGEDEIDLVLDLMLSRGRILAIECKTNPAESAKVGFHRACDAIGATDRFVVHSGAGAILGGSIDRLDLSSALLRVATIAAS